MMERLHYINVSKTITLNLSDRKYIFFNHIFKHTVTLINTVLK